MMCKSTTRWNEGACLRKIRWTCKLGKWQQGREGRAAFPVAGSHKCLGLRGQPGGSTGHSEQYNYSHKYKYRNTKYKYTNTHVWESGGSKYLPLHSSKKKLACTALLCQQGRTIVEQWVSGAGSRWWAAAPATSASGRWLQALAGPSSLWRAIFLTVTFWLTLFGILVQPLLVQQLLVPQTVTF